MMATCPASRSLAASQFGQFCPARGTPRRQKLRTTGVPRRSDRLKTCPPVLARRFPAPDDRWLGRQANQPLRLRHRRAPDSPRSNPCRQVERPGSRGSNTIDSSSNPKSSFGNQHNPQSPKLSQEVDRIDVNSPPGSQELKEGGSAAAWDQGRARRSASATLRAAAQRNTAPDR